MNAVREPMAAPKLAPGNTFKKSVMIKGRLGLHARPAALLIKALHPFRCHVVVQGSGESANAKSILGLLSLGAGCGAKLTFLAAGPDAPDALRAIEELFQEDLDAA